MSSHLPYESRTPTSVPLGGPRRSPSGIFVGLLSSGTPGRPIRRSRGVTPLSLPVEPLGILSQPKEDPMFDLKPLPDTLKYDYLDEKKVYPVIINSNRSGFEEERLLETLRRHRGAIGYTLDDQGY